MLIGLLLVVSIWSKDVEIKSRFEFEYSFKGPYIAQSDGYVPFWSYHGHAIAGDENVRLAPSLRSRQGSIWTKSMFEKRWFEIEAVIRISGRGKIGADGMAIWYTTHGAPAENELTSVYGARDQWDGVGIILDSFDNNMRGDNPSIQVHLNDGTKNYNHDEDGGGEEVGSCPRDFRNKPYPVKLKLRYYKNKLTLYYHSGVSEFDDYVICTEVENISLPSSGYFGVSAATGGLSDDHDILKFITHSLVDIESPDFELSQEEQALRDKMEEKLKEQQKEFEQERQKFAEENPNLAQQMDDNLMDGHNDPQFKAIFDVQNHIQGQIIDIRSDMKEAIKMIAKLQLTGGAPSPSLSKTNLVAAEQKNDLLHRNIQDMMTLMKDIQQKSNLLIANTRTKNQDQFDVLRKHEDETEKVMMKDSLNYIKQDLIQLTRKQDLIISKKCPDIPEVSCISGTTFFILTVIQAAIIGSIIHYRMSQEAAAKKFF